MSEDLSFADLMARVRAGDDDAAAAVFYRFVSRLIGLARSRLDPMTRRKVDPEEVANSAFKSFFRRCAEFDLEGWDNLWEVLLLITLRKCGRRVEYFRAQRRDVQREIPGPASAERSTDSWEAIAREPTPEEAAVLNEAVEQVLRDLHERERPILLMALQGYSPVEISAEVHRTERTVYRVLKRVRDKLEDMRDRETARV
jgi:RNA polymerase sigma-70 factor, ECF subfamily